MKLFKAFGLSILILVSFLQACPKFGQDHILHFEEARAERMGPGSGGGDGGDYSKDEKPSPEQVTVAIDEARRLVPFVLNYLESVITNARATGSAKLYQAGSQGDTSIPLDTFKKLFPWPEKKDDVQARWQQLQFNIEPLKPCYDEFGKEKAASAFPATSIELCVSVEMIRNVAVTANLVQRITALLVHEVSHKMEVKDHLILETAIRYGLPSNPRRVLEVPLKTLLASVDPTDKTGILTLVSNSLAKIETGKDWAAICYDLAGIQFAANNFARPSIGDGISMALLRPELEAEKQAIALRSRFFPAYCAKENSDREVDQMFQSKVAVAIHEKGSGVLSIARGTLRRPEYQNRLILKAELIDIKSSLVKISAGAVAASTRLMIR
jgi:hypothetical protein